MTERATAALEAPGVALTAPDLIRLRHTALAAAAPKALAALPGGFATRAKGRGLEVADVRPYVAGDDLRHLDRGTTARTGRPHVRQFQEERDRVVLLVADFRPAMFWGVTRALRSVAAAEALVLIGWEVVEAGGRVGVLVLRAGQPAIAPPRGRVRGMLDAIGVLVGAHGEGIADLVAGHGGQGSTQTPDPPLDRALARAERLVPAGAEVIIASGFDRPGDDLGDRLGQLARRRRLRLLRIVDAERGRLPPGGYPIKLPDGRRARVHLDGTAPAEPEADPAVAHWPALALNAGDAVEVTARRLVEASGEGPSR